MGPRSEIDLQNDRFRQRVEAKEPTVAEIPCNVRRIVPEVVRSSQTAVEGVPAYRVYGTKNGWTTETSFIDMVRRHLPTLNMSRGERGMVVVDMYSAHRTEAFRELLKQKGGWILVLVPGGCTSEVQVHDLAANKEVKEIIRRKHEELCSSRGEAVKPSRSVICKWIAEAYSGLGEKLEVCANKQIVAPLLRLGINESEAEARISELAEAIAEVELHPLDVHTIAVEVDTSSDDDDDEPVVVDVDVEVEAEIDEDPLLDGW